MNIQFTARHFHASSELQDNLKMTIGKLEKYYNNITGAHVILDAERKGSRRVELSLNILDKSVSAHSEAKNMHKAIDGVMQKMNRILKKENDKLKYHKSEPLANLVS